MWTSLTENYALWLILGYESVTCKTIKRYITSNLIPTLNENITICREKDTVGWLQFSRIVEFFKNKNRQNSKQWGCQLLCKTSQQ